MAVPAVLEGLKELRPDVPVTELPRLGHYPQIEEPARVAMAVHTALHQPSRRQENGR